MSKYIQKPVEVDARQYVGGKENGKELETWVNSLGGDATWSPENKIKDLTLPEEFNLGKSKLHMNWNIKIGTWLVYKDGFITIYPDDVFKTKFDKVEEKK
ncbi:hypothetical protein PP914_gp181 [Arthrobacter phage Qui]|uniref:Uncharacterized protein n=1 Tax=Arthrobacter phage Qui TaxID=2603260 RepID=A0A5B8WHY8_9CAUD|nr:hypothetical protein PP914_gp181 [Arthrobacter phage Qui]QED11669.1 hypothetical protein SEA_QUI_181 [Arthrobacter phage Qui]QOC56500.1 hypothetical protein SEA_PAELLA_181 [Arthrobacter phage Paella]